MTSADLPLEQQVPDEEDLTCCSGDEAPADCRALVLNLDEHGYLNPEGVQALRRLAGDLQRTGRQLLVVAPPGTEASQALENAVELNFQVCDTLEEARAACRKPTIPLRER